MLDEIGIIIQARMSSSRFPGKSMYELGKNPLIHYVVKRLQKVGLPVIVCTSSEPSDDVLEKYLSSKNIPVFRGSLENVLERYIQAAEAFFLKKVVRVTGDNPFVDVAFLQDTLRLFENYDYVDGIYKGGLIEGTGYELVTLSELKNIPSKEQPHLEHVTLWLRENLKRSSRRIPLEPINENKYRNDIFLTCDYPEDLQLAGTVLEHFGYNYSVSVSDIVQYLESNPSLKEINKFRHQSG